MKPVRNATASRRPLLPAVAAACAMGIGWLGVRADGANWPQFRGPTGQGLTVEKELPIKWSAGENLRWQAPLLGQGHASPVV